MNPHLAAAHQEHLDNLAGYEIALEKEIKAVKAEAVLMIMQKCARLMQ